MSIPALALRLRLCLLAIIAIIAASAGAQYQTPVVDGTINGGEYAHSSGNWSVTWDATYLYIAHASTAQFVVYLDVDPQATAVGGSNANGNLTGVGDGVAGSTGTITPSVPFRADARALTSSGGDSVEIRNGSGGWIAASGSPIASALGASAREVSIRWDSLPGLSGVPSAFRWLGYEMKDDGSGNASLSDPMPSVNATGTSAAPAVNYFFNIASTTDGGSTDPFSQQYRTLWVTTNADSGAGSLREAITLENADSSTRRQVVFNISGSTTIQLASSLPFMNNSGVTVDGTTQPGYVSTPIIVIRGTDPNDSVTPSMVFNVLGVFDTFRGLVIQNAYYGMYSTDGFTGLIDNCYFGVDATGLTAQANSYGVYLVDWDNSVIQNSVFSGNTIAAMYLTGRPPAILGNIVGLGADGSTPIAGSHGINIGIVNPDDGGGVGAAGNGNVFGNITGDALTISTGQVSVFGNKFGVASDGVTARPITGSAINVNDGSVLVGLWSNPADANIIANSSTGVTVTQTTSGRGTDVTNNAMFGNTTAGIATSGSGVIQPTPTVSSATVNGSGTLTITYSLAFNPSTPVADEQMVLEVYDADLTNTSVPQGRAQRGSLRFLQSADITNATWTVGSGFTAGDKIVMLASSFGNGNASISGDGSSAFTPVITTTFAADKVFTGPGNFSDTTKWNGGTLPASGQSLQIIGACTFDVTTQLAYASLTLGDDNTAGNMTFSSGAQYFLKVTDINSRHSGSSIDMTGGGSLSLSGTWTTANMTFTAGNSTVTFDGTGQTMPALTFHSVFITGSVTALSGTPVVQGGNFNVVGSFAPSSGTIEFGPTVTIGNSGGTIQFYNLTIDNGAGVTASSSFSVGSQLTVNGILTPGSSVVISGAGTMSGSGTIVVTGSTLASQYTLTTDVSAAEVNFNGSSAQTIGAGTYSSLRLSNSSGASLGGGVTTTNLYLDNGTLTTGANALSATGTVTATSGRVNGKLTRTIATGTNTYTFPVGTSSFSMPVSATFTASVAGTVSFAATSGEHPQIATSGITSTKDVNGYWTFTPGTATHGTINLTLTFGTNTDAGSTPTSFVLRAYRSSAWSNVTATPASTSISANGVTVSAQTDFAAGNNSTNHYTVTASSPQSINTAFFTTVTAVDTIGGTVNDSTTVVTMTSGSNHVKFDSNNNGNFNDNTKTLTNGSFTISTRDNTGETMTVTATDSSSKTGTSSSILVVGTASAATSTIGASPTSITADGTSTSTITVQTKDSSGNNLVIGGDTVALSTNRGTVGAVSDHGNGTYTATYTSSTTVGTATISGTVNGTAMTNSATVTLTAGNAATLSVSAPASATAGSSFSVTVTARDSHANTATGYRGTVHFTSSDGAATLPSNYTFTSGDNGVHAFTVTLNTAGSQSVTATDTVTATITGSASTTVSSAFGAPQNFAATAASASQVNLTWTPVSGATSYEIYRSSLHSAFASYATTASTSYSDNGVSANTTYLYEVRALGSGTSAFSAVDAATTIVFTDASLSSAVNIKTTHINELRTAVNAMRTAAGLSAATFTDTLSSSTPIKAIHITELRNALDAARSAIGLSAISYTDPTIVAGTTNAKAAHVTELRAGTQ